VSSASHHHHRYSASATITQLYVTDITKNSSFLTNLSPMAWSHDSRVSSEQLSTCGFGGLPVRLLSGGHCLDGWLNADRWTIPQRVNQVLVWLIISFCNSSFGEKHSIAVSMHSCERSNNWKICQKKYTFVWQLQLLTLNQK